MPLLDKETFTLKQLNPNLGPEDEVFYCAITGEAFEDYNEYFERQILCSSLLWTCSVTGKTGLTYADALKSEQESQSLLSSIPRVLQKVLLHLMTYLNNFSTNVTMSILLEFCNLRYFIGENVQIMSKNKRINGIVRDVIPPKNHDSTSVAYGIDPLLYTYVVELVGHKDHSNENPIVELIPASRISRSKCSLTREKIRLFLKQHLSPKSSRYEILTIKEDSVHKFGLVNLKWEDIFKGPLPDFNSDTTLVKAFNKDKQRLTDANDTGDSNDDSNLADKFDVEPAVQVYKKKSNLLSSQKMKLIKREEKYRVSDSIDKKGKKEKLKKMKCGRGKLGKKKSKSGVESGPRGKVEDKNREKESRRKFEEDLRLWMEKRDDLLCDDLAPLPLPTPFQCDIENHLIGDCLLIIDFINSFSEFIVFEDECLASISFDFFGELLSDQHVNGFYGQLLISLLNTIFLCNKDDQQGGWKFNDQDLQIQHHLDPDFDLQIVDDEEDSNNFNTIYSNHYMTTYFNSQRLLSQFNLTPFTLTEILRIYILKARRNESKINLICDDDYNLAVQLTLNTVFELNKQDRIYLFKLLLNDIVQIPQVRQKIEASMEEMFRLKTQIRHLNASYTKWLRDNPIRQRIRKKRQGNEQQQPENEATPLEKEQYKKDKNQKEQEMKNSISELKSQIRKLSAFCRLRPIGSDRSFRKYWIFDSIPGLLVEHSIDEVPTRSCLTQAQPMPKPKLTDYLPNAKRRKRKTLVPTAHQEEENQPEEAPTWHHFYPSVFDRCTGNFETCSVHGNAGKNQIVRWSFYTKYQLDNLINSLSARGFRENELKNALLYERQSILSDHLSNFDPTIFNSNYVEIIPENELENIPRKSERIQNSEKRPTIQRATIAKDRFSELSPFNAHQLAFKEEMENMEYDIFNGCFTSYNLADREEWCKRIPTTFFEDRIQSLSAFTQLFRLMVTSIKPFCLLPPLSVYSDSSGSSPSDKENIENISYRKPKIPSLSEKWVEILKVPSKLSFEDLIYFESSYGITNFSQLFLNINLLSRCINWDMSAMKRANKCRICRRKANEKMILCDMCNYGYHMYCLKPPVTSIDENDDWFCYNCVPRTLNKEEIVDEKPEPPVSDDFYELNDESNEDESLFGQCKICKKHVIDTYSEVSCKVCNNTFHLKCVKLARVPRSWACRPCEAKQRYEQRNSSPATSEENADLRRSTRKRKPNLHYEDFGGLDENTFYSNVKSRRFSDDDDESVVSSRGRSRRSGAGKFISNQLNSVEVSL